MKQILPFLVLLLAAACTKQSDAPGTQTPPGTPPPAKPVNSKPDTPWITVLINGQPMNVTAISFSRSGSTFNFSAWNNLQRLDAYCFWFYGTSGFNYQYSDSINYSTRPDSLAPWATRTALNTGDVRFDCCSYPVRDSIVNGNYSAPFGTGGKEFGFTITGNFHGLFQ